MTRFYERNFALDQCRKCRAPVLDGVTEGITTRCDPYALTGPGELAALIDGRTTYAVHITGRKIRIRSRASWDMVVRTLPIVTAHRCRTAPFDFDAASSRVFIDMLIPRLEPTECPF